MKLTEVSLRDSVPVLTAQGKFDRLQMVKSQDGREITYVPEYGIIVDVPGHDLQIIPLSNVRYVRAVRAGK